MNKRGHADIVAGAHFSPCRLYRYQLWRTWNESLPALNVIGLNPSTATETTDDPTIRRCINYAQQWGFGGLMMTNLFAYRATLPKIMKAYAQPVGVENDRWLVRTAREAGLVLAAWGKDGRFMARDEDVCKLLDALYCLGRNGDGTPKHPLYQRKDLTPILYNI